MLLLYVCRNFKFWFIKLCIFNVYFCLLFSCVYIHTIYILFFFCVLINLKFLYAKLFKSSWDLCSWLLYIKCLNDCSLFPMLPVFQLLLIKYLIFQVLKYNLFHVTTNLFDHDIAIVLRNLKTTIVLTSLSTHAK